ncbi:MAG: hypothetical protein RIT45_3563 [Pseudomonadota bacterium]|jgi:alkylhydroperoxidase family enzyme
MQQSGVDARLDAVEGADISAGARAMLPVLAKMAHEADALGPDDYAPVRAAGVSDAAIREALHVAYLFHIINRFADALDFEVGSDASFASSAKMLLARGYRL